MHNTSFSNLFEHKCCTGRQPVHTLRPEFQSTVEEGFNVEGPLDAPFLVARGCCVDDLYLGNTMGFVAREEPKYTREC